MYSYYSAPPWLIKWLPMIMLGTVAIVVLIGLVAVAQLLLGPINKARTRIGAPRRFVLTDVFWLMVLIQEALAFTTQFVPKNQPEAYRLILGFLIFATIGIWAGGVSVMSEAGLRHMAHRALFQLLLLPGTLLTMIAFPALVILTLTEVFELNPSVVERSWSDPLNAFYIAWAIALGGAVFLRWLSVWLSRRAEGTWPAATLPGGNQVLSAT
jgi:hypothetical protein